MPIPHVTLSEVLSALGGPLGEKSLWAVLLQAATVLRAHIKASDGGATLLITPETLLLKHGGAVQLLQGISDNSGFTAPEHFAGEAAISGEKQMEKSYVYSLGITLFHAMEYGLGEGQAPLVSDQLHTLLIAMIEDSVDQRASLEYVIVACQQHVGEHAEEEVESLITYLLGTAQDISSDEYGDVDMDDDNLESELNDAMKIRPTGSVEKLYSPSYGSRTGSSLSLTSKGSQSVKGSSGSLHRNLSFQGSVGSRENLAPAPLGSLPPVYYYSGGSQDRLNMLQKRAALAGRSQGRDHRWSSHERLMTHIQPQDLEVLMAKGVRSGRQLPHEPSAYGTHSPISTRKPMGGQQVVDIRRSASFQSHYTSSVPRYPPGAGMFRTSSDGRPEPGMFRTLSDGRPEKLKALSSPEKGKLPSPERESLPPPQPIEAEPLLTAKEIVVTEDQFLESVREPFVRQLFAEPQLQEPAGEKAGVDIDHVPAGEKAGVDIDDGLPGEKAGVDIDHGLPGEKAGVDIDHVPTGEKAGVDINHGLAGEKAGVDIDHGLAREKAGVDIDDGLAGEKAGEEETSFTLTPEVMRFTDDMPSLPPRRPPPPPESPIPAEEESALPPEVIPSLEKIDFILQSEERRRQDSSDAGVLEETEEPPLAPTSPPPSDNLAPEIDGETLQSTPQPQDPDTASHPPPPPPTTEPPMFTPYKLPEAEQEVHIRLSATFDYSEMGDDLVTTTEKGKPEDEFEFPIPDSPPPVPFTSPPHEQDTSVLDEVIAANSTPPPLPPSSPPRLSVDLEEAAMIIEQYLQQSPPVVEDSEKEDDETSLGEDAERSPRRALDFEEDEQETIDVLGLQASEVEGEESVSDREKRLSELYAKVQKPRKRDMDMDESDDDDEERQGSGDLYAKVMKSKRSMEHAEAEDTPPEVQDLVRNKASSAGDIMSVHYAVVHDPKRMSMPPDSLAAVHYSEVAPTSPSVSPPSSLPSVDVGRMFDVTVDEDWKKLQENKTSLEKLQRVFGPEFAHLSGGQKKKKGKSTVTAMPEGRRVVRVILLNAHTMEFLVEHDSFCRDLFQQVISHLGLREPHLFGLAVVRDRDEVFLDFDRKLSKYAPRGWATTPPAAITPPITFIIYFRVKYYVENVSMLRLAQTRHQYYLQLRKDILEAKMFCHEQSALKLAAYALQAEKGDYNHRQSRYGYFRLEDYLPVKVLEKLDRQYLSDLLPDMHAERYGLGRELAELEFLKEAQKLPEYGMVFYRVAKEKHGAIGDVWLGLCVRGVVMYDVHKDVKTPVHHCPWRKTQNISFANRKLIIELQGSKPLVFYTVSYKRARYLLHLSISYHRFQLYTRGLLAQEALSVGMPEEVGMGTEPDGEPVSPHKGDEGVCDVKLLKDPVKGLGIRITDQPAPGNARRSIVAVEEVVKGGPAYIDGKLKTGDVLLMVNGQSLEGMGHREAAKVLKNAPNVVKLTVQCRTPELKGSPERPESPEYDALHPLHPPSTHEEFNHLTPLKEEPVAMVTEVIVERPPEHFNYITPVKEDPVAMVTEVTVEQPPTLQEDQSPEKGEPVAMVTEVVVEPSHTFTRRTTLETKSTPVSPQPTYNLMSPTPYESLTVHLKRGENGSFGFAIAGHSQDIGAGVVVHKVTVGGSADGTLKFGDRFVSVNGVSAEQKSYDEVLSLIQGSGENLQLGIRRRASPASFLNTEGLPEGHPSVIELEKQHGALGLRISGGIDKVFGSGFIHVKTITPGSAAAECDRIHEGDIILQVNEDSLVGVTHRQAADVLLHTPEKVYLLIYHPTQPEWYRQLSPPPPDETYQRPISEPTMTRLALLVNTSPLSSSSEPHLCPSGGEDEGLDGARSEPHLLDDDDEGKQQWEEEREVITLRKGMRGFGFRVDKSLSGQKDRGLFVLSVDGNPAKRDGRLRAGDEIIQINGMSLVNRAHDEGVKVMRSVSGTGAILIRRKKPFETDRASHTPDMPRSHEAVPSRASSSVRSRLHIPPPPATPPPPLDQTPDMNDDKAQMEAVEGSLPLKDTTPVLEEQVVPLPPASPPPDLQDVVEVKDIPIALTTPDSPARDELTEESPLPPTSPPPDSPARDELAEEFPLPPTSPPPDSPVRDELAEEFPLPPTTPPPDSLARGELAEESPLPPTSPPPDSLARGELAEESPLPPTSPPPDSPARGELAEESPLPPTSPPPDSLARDELAEESPLPPTSPPPDSLARDELAEESPLPPTSPPPDSLARDELAEESPLPPTSPPPDSPARDELAEESPLPPTSPPPDSPARDELAEESPLPPTSPPPDSPVREDPPPFLSHDQSQVKEEVIPDIETVESCDDLDSLSPSEGSDDLPSISSGPPSQLLDDFPPLPSSPPPLPTVAALLKEDLTSSEEFLTPQQV